MQLIILLVCLMAIQNSGTETKQFNAERVSRSASFTINAFIEKAFPMFGPIQEKEWAAGWNPEIIYSTTNDVEEHMIFRTNARHAGEDDYIWIINQYRPQEHLIEYTVSTSQRIWFITVKCESQGERTKVTVTYSYTGLTPEGNQLNKAALEKMYAHNLKDWEDEINYYLETGKQKH